MHRTAFLAVAAMLLRGACLCAQPNQPPDIAPTEARTPAEERLLLKVPPGFEVQLVASEPDIHKPLNIRFDERGRLWVTDTIEYPYPTMPWRKGRDTVKILEDFGPDGRARKITTFADGLNIPIGLMPLWGRKPQDALVFSIPAIHLLSDTTGGGRANQDRVLFEGYGHKDTHGMTSSFTVGFDGWVYACHGYANDSTISGSDGQELKMNSGNTYRFRPDGSHVEIFTRGQVNPFGLCFDPLGNLYSADCHSQPVYQLQQGGYYPSFSKGHDGLGFAPEMTTDDHGSTAIAGIVYYAADQFPKEYLDTVFIGNVVTCRITLDRVVKTGSSPKAVRQPDFLVSGDPWFRPVDIQLGPDGALYVADFYNRIIGHYEVPLSHPGRDRERGRIWRIVYRGRDGKKSPPPLPDLTKRSIPELIQDLGSPILTVRFQAGNQLVERGGSQTALLLKAAMDAPESKHDEAWLWRRVHALWVLERTGQLDAETLADALHDVNAPVRIHAQRILAERKKLTYPELAMAMVGLSDADAEVRRAAALALGRHPAPENLRPLLELRYAVPHDDTHLTHVVRMALRDQFLTPSGWAALQRIRPTETDLFAVADVALGVPTAESAYFLLTMLPRMQDAGQTRDSSGLVIGSAGRMQPLISDRNLYRAVQHVARHGSAETTLALNSFVRTSRPADLTHQAALFRALNRGTQERGGKLSDDVRTWAVDVATRLLASANENEVRSGIEMVGVLKVDDRADRLAAIAARKTASEPLRTAALNGLAALDAVRHTTAIGAVLNDSEAPPPLRELAANLLVRANQTETLNVLVKALPTAPARLQTVIAAGLAASANGAELLLKTIEEGKASARLLQERAVEVKLNDSKLPMLKERIAKLTAGLPPAEVRIQQAIEQRRKGYLAMKNADPVVGGKVFETHCAVCHQIGGKGARVGPNLDGIGVRGLDRLLEDVLDPNRNVDQAFRTTVLQMKNGKLITGLLLREEGEVYVLADSTGMEVRVEKKTVEERSTSQVSPMPANLEDRIPETEFYHLMAYLLAQRSKT
jgi:putative heme-binding domain-containing protein